MNTSQTVLFLCSGNYYRSRFAEHLFNSLAATLGSPWRAESRGFRLHPLNVGPISPHAAAALKLRNIAIADPNRSALVAMEQDLAAAGLIIALKEAEHRPMMQQYFPAWLDRVEFWHIHDIDVAAPEQALAELESHVADLLKRLT